MLIGSSRDCHNFVRFGRMFLGRVESTFCCFRATPFCEVFAWGIFDIVSALFVDRNPVFSFAMNKLDVVMKKLFSDFSVDENSIHDLDISTVEAWCFLLWQFLACCDGYAGCLSFL
jgi:hypothetical protein